MSFFKKPYSGLKGVLFSSVAMIGLASVAQAQVAELKGLMDNKDFGGSSSFYLPLGNVNTGMPFLNIGAGLLGGSKSGEALLGYGQGFGNVGIRGYAGVGLKDSHHNLFTTAKAGVELSIGGFGLNVSGSIPFGKTRQVAKNGHSDVVLVDPSGQQCDPTGACVPVPPSCSNPAPGQVKHCEIGVAVTDPSYEKALKGFEVGLDYQVQVGGVWLRPSLGYYRYGNGLVSGAKAGLEVSLPLTSQLSLNIGAGGQKELRGDNKGLSGFGSLGISYHFGSVPVSQLSALEHRFAEAPTRNQRTLTTHTQGGNTTIYRNTYKPGQGITGVTPDVGAIWDENTRHHFVSNVYLIDAGSASQLDEVVAAAEEDAIVVVDGSKGDINLDNVVIFGASGVGVVGGGAKLGVAATMDRGKTFINETLNMPGSRPTLIQPDAKKNVFLATTVDNPILYGLDMKGGYNGAAFLNANNARVMYVQGEGAQSVEFGFAQSNDVVLYQVKSLGDGDREKENTGFSFQNSNRALLVEDTSDGNQEGFYFDHSDDATLFKVNSSGFDYGIAFVYSHRASVFNAFVELSKIGIEFDHSSNGKLQLINVESSPNAIVFEQSDNATLDQVNVFSAFFAGVAFKESHHAKLSNIKVVYVNLDGVLIKDSNDILLDNITVQGSDTSGTGIRLANAGKVGQEISLSNVLVRELTIGYALDKNSAVKDLRFNVALFVNHICDGVDDASGSILVNGLTKCR